jgi:glucose dehydrogenase
MPQSARNTESGDAVAIHHSVKITPNTLLTLTVFALPIAAALLLLASGTRIGAQMATPGRLDWAFYGNDPGGMRYVDIDQINPSNVATLQPAWIFHTKVMSNQTSFESQPIIVDGVMYVTSPHGHVFALDAATGALKWTFNPDIPPLSELAICCGQTNRGVAVGGGKVFVAQLDATLIALDAATGRVIWKVAVDRWQDRWTETMAPLLLNNKVIIGASGGEYQRRGHVRAYDADSAACFGSSTRFQDRVNSATTPGPVSRGGPAEEPFGPHPPPIRSSALFTSPREMPRPTRTAPNALA